MNTDTKMHRTVKNKRVVTLIININPLSANPIKWSNTLKQFFDHFVKLAHKRLRPKINQDYLGVSGKNWRRSQPSF